MPNKMVMMPRAPAPAKSAGIPVESDDRAPPMAVMAAIAPKRPMKKDATNWSTMAQSMDFAVLYQICSIDLIFLVRKLSLWIDCAKYR